MIQREKEAKDRETNKRALLVAQLLQEEQAEGINDISNFR